MLNCLQKNDYKGKHSVLEMYKLVKIIDSFYISNSVKSIRVDFTWTFMIYNLLSALLKYSYSYKKKKKKKQKSGFEPTQKFDAYQTFFWDCTNMEILT